MKTICLNSTHSAKVDDQDFDSLTQWKWAVLRAAGGLLYAVRYENRQCIRMHRVINETPCGMFTDHKDGDGLNNQRHNLRAATPLQNMMNRRGKRGGTSSFKGVWFDNGPQKQKWRTAIRVNGTRQYLGRFDTEEEAGAAYASAALFHFGDFACIQSGVIK